MKIVVFEPKFLILAGERLYYAHEGVGNPSGEEMEVTEVAHLSNHIL